MRQKDLMDPVTKALIETIGDAGYVVQVGASDGQHVIEAIREGTGERFVVRGDDLYRVAVELAEQAGIDRMIESKRKSSLTREQEIKLWESTHDADELAAERDLCLPCAEAILDAAEK